MANSTGVVSISNPPEESLALFEWYKDQRASSPVGVDDEGIWHAFRYDDVSRILSDSAVFSSDLKAFMPAQEDIQRFTRGNFVAMDPPEHGKLRGLVTDAFTPGYVARFAPRIRQIAGNLLDRVAGNDRLELVSDYAYQLPVVVVAELLGIPVEEQHRFTNWAQSLLSGAGVRPADMPDDERLAAVVPTVRDMHSNLLEHVRWSRARGTADNLTTRLLAAHVDGRPLHDDEIVGIIAMILLAGHVTTTLTLGNAVLLFSERPELLAQVRGDVRILPKVIEEVVRYRGPLPRQTRLVVQDVQLSGQTVPAGCRIQAWIASANRDEQRFLAPDTFDPTRHPNPHIGWGRGVHFCIGAPLARIELKLALEVILERLADFRLGDDGVVFQDARVMTGVRRAPLDIRWA